MVFFQVDEEGQEVYKATCRRPRNLYSEATAPLPYHGQTVPCGTTRYQVRSLLDGVIVFGFALHNDTKVLGLSLPSALATQEDCVRSWVWWDSQTGQYHSLTLSVLGRAIQEGSHDTLVDARATMELFLCDRAYIEAKVCSTYVALLRLFIMLKY